ncbi:MAG: RNA polymerase sigma factor [Rivularia sp. (in: cyanobacteria)]
MSNQIAANSQQKDCTDFWLLWQEHQSYLYHRCLGWMGENPTEAEDALSRAMLKAWEKVQEYAGKINNLKSWLTTLVHNLCVDIHRQRSRSANRVEDIEAIGDEQALVCSEDTPQIILETQEKNIEISRAIENLPSRLRETFILHFYQQLPYQEIAQQQEISYNNVCKRISQARKILREELRKYFIGEDKDSSVLPAATDSVSEEVSESGGVSESVVSVAVEELQEESVAVVKGFEERVCEFSLVAILVLTEFYETGVEVQEQCFEGNGWGEFVRLYSNFLGVLCRAPPEWCVDLGKIALKKFRNW